jgi:Cys-tRNA(Pro)/Cys-tRNA(Cys) deacylase
MGIVNNVTRMLISKKIDFSTYELPNEKLGAKETANILGVDPAIVFKTIVVTREKPKKPILVVLPGTTIVDLKLVANALGEKKVTLPTEREAEAITDLQVGGISPLALINKGYIVLIDVSAKQFQQIHISGGQKGLNIKLRVDELAELTKARFESVSRPDVGG